MVAAAGCVALVAVPVSAATTVQLTQNLPTTPVQLTVGDQINLTLAPVTPAVPSGYSGPSTVRYPAPTTSDGTVLALTSATYDSGGTEHATFQAATAGTAKINVVGPSYQYCAVPPSTTSSSSTTTSTTTATPTPTVSCVVADPALQSATVVVSNTGVQGASVTTPATGSAGSSTAGLGLALLGLMVTGGALAVVRSELRRRR